MQTTEDTTPPPAESPPRFPKTLAVTGHRPSVLGGWDEPNATSDVIKADMAYLARCAVETNYGQFYTGMAQGVDTWWAEILLELKREHPSIFITACVPFPQFPNVWPTKARERYYDILGRCDGIITVNLKSGDISAEQLRIMADQHDPRLDVPYQAAKWNDVRNHYMVNGADKLIAFWNGFEKGGTFNCIKYARKVKCPIIIHNTNTRGLKIESGVPIEQRSAARVGSPNEITPD